MADTARRFVIRTPRGSIYTFSGRNGRVTARIEWNPGFSSEYEARFSRKQKFVDQECIRRMASDTPRRTGVLIKSATLGTVIGSGVIHQIAPYARRQYYEHKTKSKWFERMKNRDKDVILRGAQQIN